MEKDEHTRAAIRRLKDWKKSKNYEKSKSVKKKTKLK